MQLTDFITQTAAYQELAQGLRPASRQLVTGIAGSARTLLIKSLLADQALAQSIVFVTDTMFHADQLVDDLSNVLDDNQLYEFPVEELLAAEVATSSPDFLAQRIQALSALRSDQPVVVVTSVSGIRRQLPVPTDFDAARIQLTTGMDIELDDLIVSLQKMGYHRQKLVDTPGDFAVRGAILDIYPLDLSYPVRVDFFDTEIDSLRFFDASTQRSVENIESVTILPVTDLLLDDDQRTAAVSRLNAALTEQKAGLSEADFEQLENTVTPLLEDLQHGGVNSELLLFQDYLFDHHTLLDYLDESGLLLIDDYPRIREANHQLEEDEANWATDKLAVHQVFANQVFGLDFLRVLKKDQHAQAFFALFQKGMGNMRFSQIVNFVTRTMQQFFGQMPLLKQEVKRWQTTQQTVVMMVANTERLNKVGQTLTDFGITSVLTKDGNLQPGAVQLISGQLQAGFELPAANLVVVTETEMFKKVAKHHKRRQTLANAERLKSYTDLKPGDYVVHVNHGIGRFEGMQTMAVDGVHQDYMTIAYQKNAKLFIPVTQLNLIQKYVSSEDKTPHVNRLGGADWEKTKKKVAAKIEDIADDLVALYAAREAEKGFAFPKDDDYQNEFDNAFPYTETPDQLRSIEEIKHDMERSRPMDRLLVGDVGYGKTEVALRAAFKAVEAGKQVAFLVPTTILAQQHYDTMATRFDGYPINVAILSRFQTTAEVKQTVAGLKDGSVDIVVGTHRLLSKDIAFNDLGLLLVDEEQRFGVKHKERLKQLKSQVDVLTLTATPIPRTLHMSMLGVRDLSVIETPPANRFPIQTYVMEQNAGAIQDGIHREMARGGQVFYLHNRVDDIEKTVDQLKLLVPDAEIGYIHGQMTEAQLEGVLYDFVQGTYDVLVTTTIIETGIDIANVNTMFIENADRMGLSQLYQLRGRIGRSNRVAYAYFMYQPNKVLTEVSEKRLEAIKDFTELGSGFKIAMRDLSIRGAGNLLGKQQHGFIDSVGYDLYTQMLTDAVAAKQGKKAKPKTDATVELGLEAYLPDDYIADQQQKIEMYKRIRQIESHDDMVEIQDDLMDRFGDYPQEVANLLAVSQVKVQADTALISKIHRNHDKVIVAFSAKGTDRFSGEDVFKALSKTRLKATVGVENDRLVVRLVIQPKMTAEDWLAEVTLFVNGLSDMVTELSVE
ncbi:transcription-repair coupling factor [uncultured Secundilactobacillus sp.]|uniref:transcription-repair coupling factor n=1 Tax=uncultured Secundilactobacillus sp. TaxID=2813935 RepID=UPI002591A3A5|nr:transcription-repair coupling factor [uncultured Secundilactobacillus sp.]